ncbi:phage tail sheath family protein [Trinickia sp.]|uniref:phage tail sheath family protein n=1 Tax=Trinickia sp. TaxID=2571163 RepID=UPI003F804A19
MDNDYRHPGVYIKELPAVPSVQGVSTSIPVFIGATEKLDALDRNTARRVTSWADFQTRYGGFVWGAFVSAAVFEFFAESGSICYVVGMRPDPAPAPATAQVTDGNGGYTFAAASCGEWPNSLLNVAVFDVGAPPSAGQASNHFSINTMINASDLEAGGTGGDASLGIWPELFRQFIRANSIKPTRIPGDDDDLWYCLERFGPYSSSSLPETAGGPCALIDQINAQSMFIRVVSTPAKSDAPDSARDGTPVAMAGGDAVEYDTLYGDALRALSAASDASLLATPDAALVDLAGDEAGASLKNVITTVMNACTKVPNFFYVVDAPYADDPSEPGTITSITQFVSGGDTGTPLIYENAAIYYPWIFVLNPATNTSVPVPPSGAVLGRYAATDHAAGVHVSPAGVRTGRIVTATALTGWLTEGDQDLLNPCGINVIRNIPGYGITIYGARTLDGQSPWQYIAVRRFVTFVEQSLKMSLEWVVFQPNGPLLWATVVREVTAFLTMLWRQGALYGASVGEAFFVTCDASNNPPESRTQGVLNVDVGLAVLYPAEFVVIRIAQMSTGSTSS